MYRLLIRLSHDLSYIFYCKNIPSPKRLIKFLTVNNYNDEKKAFLPGINGTIEHNVVLEEIISQAKTNKKTVRVTFFDSEDAFGSVPHPLIIQGLMSLQKIQQYINTLYNN